MQESDILFFFNQVHKLQPGFYLAVDKEASKVLWVIRGEPPSLPSYVYTHDTTPAVDDEEKTRHADRLSLLNDVLVWLSCVAAQSAVWCAVCRHS